MHLRIFILIILFFITAGGAKAEDKNISECSLENKEFCGAWDPVSQTMIPAGLLTMLGHRMDWDDGNYYKDCKILDEMSAPDTYSVLECMSDSYDSSDQTVKRPKFFLLKLEEPSSKDKMSLGIWFDESLPCIFVDTFGFKEEYESARTFFSTTYRCGGSYTAYARPD